MLQQSSVDIDSRQALRRELGSFLRARREQADPASYGILPNVRRRAKGLRREELAQLVDVGITWYTWLEQGRDVRPSSALLQRLANALNLSDQDRRHLFELSQPARERTAKRDTPTDSVLQEVVQSFAAGPAYVRNARYDLIVFNEAMGELFGIKPGATGLARNLLWLTFTDPRTHAINVNWDAAAGVMLGGFRSAYGKHCNDPSFNELVVALEQASSTFADWWKRYYVWTPAPHGLQVAPRAASPVDVNVSYFDIAGDDDRVLVVMTPLKPVGNPR